MSSKRVMVIAVSVCLLPTYGTLTPIAPRVCTFGIMGNSVTFFSRLQLTKQYVHVGVRLQNVVTFGVMSSIANS